MPDDVDYPVNRSDANDPEPDNSEATQDRRHATTSIFDDRYTVEEKRRRGDNRPVNEARPDDRSGGGRYGETARDNRSGDRRNDQDNRAGAR
ncbi:MAG: hypothetical protein LUG50_07025, partial [Planctomycetaceae bacterium]|nr:hypothetical protein [Planctomycetaceae bacterium]